MSFTLNTITLPVGLYWSDKYDYSPVVQNIDYTLSGNIVIDEGTRIAGRPITLVGGINKCWVTRELLDQIYALTITAASIMTLNLAGDGNHSVVWSRNSAPIEAGQLLIQSEPTVDTLYSINKLSFIEV